MLLRRQFLLSSAALAAAGSKTKGVTIGVQTYSLRDRDTAAAAAACKQLGVTTVEMWSGHAEPFRGQPNRDEVRKWRLETPLSHFTQIRKLFADNGVQIHAYNYSFRDDFTDPEIARGFEFADALGAKIITASGTVSVARRVDKFAQKAKIRVGMHNHSRIVPNEFATPEDFLSAMKGASKYVGINLDIGHFTAANFAAVDYLSQHHKSIVTLHIKDRKKDQGANLPFGEGDTPIREVLTWLKTNRSPIPANIEYEYRGADTLVELGKCLDYCRKIVA
jgi:sugar phosphate isomerase/epimerase